jgi:hypothetical protein
MKTCIIPNCDNEIEDDWISDYCREHNDALIEHANVRREWDYYHNEPEPDENHNC